MNHNSAPHSTSTRRTSFADRLGHLPHEGAVGVASALIDTVGPTEAVDLMVEHFGWDATMQAVCGLADDRAGRVMYLTVRTLVSNAA